MTAVSVVRRLRPVVMGLALAVAACGGNADEAATSKTAPPSAPAAPVGEEGTGRPKIVALGDSLTAGLGLLENQAYPALLQQRIEAEGYGFEVVNAGVSGDTSAGGLRRLDWALEGDVRILILALGANDGLRGLPVDEMKRNLETIITRAKERNIVVILAGMEAPPNYGPEYTAGYRRVFQDVAREQRVLFVPFLLVNVAGNAALNQSDGIHPNPEGARIIAETMWQVIRPVLDQMAAAA